MPTPMTIKSSRITELDALRGLAVIGIVWMNVYVFALPAQGYYNPIAWSGLQIGEAGPFDRLVWTGSFVFIEDKFRTLFAMLFGVGCIILLEKGGERRWQKHYARMAVLFVIGLIHALLLANNDILRAYALAGCALPFLAHLSARAFIAVAVALVAVHLGGGIITFGGAIYDWYQGQLKSELVIFAERNFGSDPDAVRYSLAQGQESFGERVERRFAGVRSQLITIAGAVPLNLAGMALGMALWKDGMLSGEWRMFRLQRLAAICGVLSIVPLFAMASWTSGASFPGVLVGPASLILSAPFDATLGVAYAALAMAFFDRGGAFTRLLASTGRLSLTNYLMTSILFAAIFASWGLGLFGQVSRAEAFALSFVPIIAMLAWSPIWVRTLGQGPFERLWRGVARMFA